MNLHRCQATSEEVYGLFCRARWYCKKKHTKKTIRFHKWVYISYPDITADYSDLPKQVKSGLATSCSTVILFFYQMWIHGGLAIVPACVH